MNYEGLKIPYHVGLILDGNGRWAKRRGLIRSKGHEAGFETLKEASKFILKSGVKVLSVYAFSTENFKRSEEEVNFLMDLFASKFRNEMSFFNENDIKIVFSGKKEKPLPNKVIEAMEIMEKETKNNKSGILNVCINYGGRAEIIDAFKKMSNDNIDINKLDEETFNKYLYQDLPPLDLMIRTSGEQRLSNFMLWQISYAELYFTETAFPDFNEEEYYKAILAYSKRDRRFGGIKE